MINNEEDTKSLKDEEGKEAASSMGEKEKSKIRGYLIIELEFDDLQENADSVDLTGSTTTILYGK